MPATKNDQHSIDPIIALLPNNVDAIPKLLEEITHHIQLRGIGDNTDRQELLIKCRSLVQAIETPRETMVKHCWAQVSISLTTGF